ncbi:MAG: FxDxF family PEP-CTERM protein [Nitrosomonas sp.]|uniref:FxDxF family PEP-CTERM protein n=1 Tax=Nitrosomonas sp. TaxID=42353 RepID=UPI001A5E6787|nr:FxDxF family PEP-CTERM protein [Nitrosomonas sp.]MBL8501504.1 FxDxF family PEP-CTERM protein [Nitrosomonas sp.]UJP01380.1 MAG: FxDxF family PEP-CTERM protein [Nitrosomonas sp.]UJP01886.1 MAG: FxDxF family PEP-CTERM protein [Nitrosomonas sp.]
MFQSLSQIITRLVTAVIASGAISMSAQAFPIAAPGTEGLKVFATGGEIKATYEGNSASFSNDLYLGSTFIFNNHATPVGTEVSLGFFAAGTELIFNLHVNNTGDDFFTGPGSRNLDGYEHARVESNWLPGTTLVSFEDLSGGPFDYNDLSFSFTNTVAAVPEPETYAMLLAGLGLLGFMIRRKKVSI